jgi:putative protease
LKPLNYYKSSRENLSANELPKELVCVNNEEAFKAAVDSGIENIAVNIFNRGNSFNLNNIKAPKLYLKIPNIIKEEFEFICKVIEEQLPRIEGILTGNLGIINRFKGRTTIIGDYKLNVFNSFSLSFYENLVQGVYLSVELNKKEIGELLNRNKASYGVLVYGRAELMVSEYCPIGSMFGGKDLGATCNKICENGTYVLKDRKDEEFLVSTDKFCRSYIYNNVPMNLIGNLDEMKKMNLSHFRLDFIDESYDEVVNIIKNFKEGQWSGDLNNFTRGHFKRGVE